LATSILFEAGFNVRQNMIGRNEFRKPRNTIENRSRSVMAHSGAIVSVEHGDTSRLLPHSREVLLRQAHVKCSRYLRTETNVTEQPYMTNTRISRRPKDLEVSSLSMAL
jgi:hypothetical protein